jgi:threonine dehydratase/cystathionine beta-lyase/cystathionine gamma-synthase
MTSEHLVKDIDPFAAAEELRDAVVRTPVRRLPWLERRVGVPVWAKLEAQQHTGSFKYRGAHLAVTRHPGRSIIAASAGNHGLAVAEVTRRLGRRANICIPVVASRLKRERILATGAGIIEYGHSLEEATTHARQLAAANDLHFVSPYNDRDVIAGSSTIALEFLVDVPELTTIVAPVGGGGLISGLGVGARAAGSDVELLGCEPSRYASVSASLAAEEIVRVVHQPTFADGLAVNLEPGSITYPLVDRYVSDTLLLSEEELAAATYALLVHESLLIEPAGAAAVVACLRLAAQGRLTGPVGIPLCGGNLHHTVLSRIQRFPYTDPELIRLLDLRGRIATAMPVPITHPLVAAPRTGPQEAATPEADRADERKADLSQQLATCLEELAAARMEIEEYDAYCAHNDLAVDAEVIGRLTNTIAEATGRIARQRGAFAEHTGDDTELLVIGEVVLRFGRATLSYVRGAMEWCSQSYAQSRVVQFFHTGAQDSPAVNYDRYEIGSVRAVETQLRDVLGLRPDRQAVSVTSSGMAAYSLLESYLLRFRLRPDDTVLLAPYIYFEAAEQLVALPFLRFVRASGYHVEDLVAAVARHRPRCLFVDPLANTAQQQMVDIPELLRRLRATVTERLTVVIDGTMVACGLPAEALSSDERVEVLYYESCSKYLQLGLDAGMAGMVAYPVEAQPQFERLRRNTGSILYRHYADLFPRYDRAFLRRRMRRISDNATRVATLLVAHPGVREAGSVFCPGHPEHVDHDIAARLPYAGGCVTFLFHEAGRNHRDQLEPMVDHMLAMARSRGVHLTKGVSFGFSTPRISAAASMAETEPPFLRLYVGDRSEAQVEALATAFADAVIG